MKEDKNYVNGQKVHELIGDTLTYYYKNGILKAQGLYVNELMEGEWLFYRETGQLWQIGCFKTNQKHGQWVRFNKEGELEYQETFENGKAVNPAQDAATVSDYILSFPEQVQVLLSKMREAILESALDAAESISYKMPAYKVNGKPLAYFAAFKTHIGFYATPTGHAAFSEELAKYKQGKGSVQFPFQQPLPLELIKRIIRFNAQQINNGKQ